MPPLPSRAEPRRQERSIRNDERILDAAVALLAEEGWAGLLPARAAKRSGLSQPTVTARYPDRSAMGAAVWRSRLAKVVETALIEMLDAAGQFGGAGDPRRFRTSLAPFLTPDEVMQAAGEVLVVGSFDPLVREAVGDTLGIRIAEWLTPAPRRLPKAETGRRGYLVAMALGLLLESRRQPDLDPDLSRQFADVLSAMEAGSMSARLPSLRFAHWDQEFDFGTGDVLLERLLAATLTEIGSRGFDVTTVDDIAAAAGHTKGLVFSRYPSKKQLFLDATDRYSAAMFVLNDALYDEIKGSHSAGVAEAVLIREFMRPGREHLRVFALEQHRLSWHDQELRDAVAHAMDGAIEARMSADPSRSRREWESQLFFDVALGVGFPLLAGISPGAWDLPYQTVTVPLLDR